MTRFSAAKAISICWLLFIAAPAGAQSEQDNAPPARGDDRCFPWQELRDGTCVAKPVSAPTPAIPSQCIGGTSDATGQCVCPADRHLDSANGSCVANVRAPRKANDNVVCDGGALVDGKCTCPAGFDLLPAISSVASSGTCVKTSAPNCQGGNLTVAGTCFCNGDVVMSGETYALEWLNGKCVPKRCPVHSYLKEGKCVAAADKGFGFTCRTGYLPDEANPGTAATGLHCLPDPMFCPPDARRRNGSCPKPSATAIDCFEAKCVCRDPHADWVNYLCQCSPPYRNVDGACVSGVAEQPARGREERGKIGEPQEQSEEPAPRHRACAHGTIRTHSGCAASRKRLPAGVALPNITAYPGQYYPPGSRPYRLRDYPIPQQQQ